MEVREARVGEKSVRVCVRERERETFSGGPLPMHQNKTVRISVFPEKDIGRGGVFKMGRERGREEEKERRMEEGKEREKDGRRGGMEEREQINRHQNDSKKKKD